MHIGIAYLGVFVGAGLCLIGGALGISKLASAALEDHANCINAGAASLLRPSGRFR